MHFSEFGLDSGVSSLELEHFFDQFVDVSEALENCFFITVLFQERTEEERQDQLVRSNSRAGKEKKRSQNSVKTGTGRNQTSDSVLV